MSRAPPQGSPWKSSSSLRRDLRRAVMKSLQILTPALLAGALVLAGCTSSSKEPQQTPTSPVPPVQQTTYNVSVTANPSQLTAGAAGSSSTITVTVRRADNGQPPPD